MRLTLSCSLLLVSPEAWEAWLETLQVCFKPCVGHLWVTIWQREDILLVRMTTDQLRPKASRYRYSNAITGFFRLVKEEGVKGLFRGLGPNTVRHVYLFPKKLVYWSDNRQELSLWMWVMLLLLSQCRILNQSLFLVGLASRVVSTLQSEWNDFLNFSEHQIRLFQDSTFNKRYPLYQLYLPRGYITPRNS